MKHFNKIFTVFAFAAAIVLGAGLFYADAQAAAGQDSQATASYSASHHGGWGSGGCGPRGGCGGY